MINTQTDPVSQARWDGKQEGYKNVKGQSLKKSKLHLHENQNPLLGFTANPQVPRICSLIQGWPLPLF